MGQAVTHFPLSNAGANKEIADGIAEGLFFNPVVTEERQAAAFATFLKTNLTASAEACDACASARGASKEGQPLRQGRPCPWLPISKPAPHPAPRSSSMLPLAFCCRRAQCMLRHCLSWAL
jgi:hypothetical protein